ncbi:hypothetical protein AVEN_275400-1, partial [Araneus ventricosus]
MVFCGMRSCVNKLKLRMQVNLADKMDLNRGASYTQLPVQYDLSKVDWCQVRFVIRGYNRNRYSKAIIVLYTPRAGVRYTEI